MTKQFANRCMKLNLDHARYSRGVLRAVSCWAHNKLRTSICELRNVAIDGTRIKMADGGEPIDRVIGRQEESEFPVYSLGAISATNCFARKDWGIKPPLGPWDDDALTLRFPAHLKSMVNNLEMLTPPPTDNSSSIVMRVMSEAELIIADPRRHFSAPSPATFAAHESAAKESEPEGRPGPWEREWAGLRGLKASQRGPSATVTPDSAASSTTPLHELQCDAWVDEPALLITRYEYANLYHTTTDWYNVYQLLRMLDLPLRDTLIVFVDGHSAGAMDDAWTNLFGSRIRYLQHMLHMPAPPVAPQAPAPLAGGPNGNVVAGGAAGAAISPAQFQQQRLEYLRQKSEWDRIAAHRRLCFSRAYTVSPGYQSPLSIAFMTGDMISCQNNPLLHDFTAHWLASYRLPTVLPVPFREARLVILVVLRRDYLAHPRIAGRHASRRISNEKEFLDMIRTAVPNSEVRAVDFAQMPSARQIAMVRDADILVAMHGAAMTYIPLLAPHAGVFEIATVTFSVRVHFEYFSHYAGVLYGKLQVPDPPTEDGVEIKAVEIHKPLADFVALVRQRLPSWHDVPELAQRLQRIENATRDAAAKAALVEAGRDAALLGARRPLLAAGSLPADLAAVGLSGDRGHVAIGSMSYFELPARPALIKHRLAVLVPFRDDPTSTTSQGSNRTANLNEFVPYMTKVQIQSRLMLPLAWP
jgi:hypothetical protein